MSITKDTIKETIKTIMAEEGDYKAFFKKALEKAGKSIPSMSDEEKKKFFNKIDTAWDGKGEKNEGNAFGAAVVAAKEAGEDEFEVDGEKFKVEESHSDCGCGCGGVTEGGCNTKSVTEARLGKVLLLKDVEKGKTSSVEGVKLSKDLAFEIRTFLERPMLSRSRTGIKLDNSQMGDVIPMLAKIGIHKRLSSTVKQEFADLLKKYK
jgi:hypothetical protein